MGHQPTASIFYAIAIEFQNTPRPDAYASLFKSQRVQVTQAEKVQFFPESNTTGFIEYVRDGSGIYRVQKQGEIQKPFFQYRGQSQELNLFLDPKTLLKWNSEIFGKHGGENSVLGLLEPNLALIHQSVAAQKQIQQVRVMGDKALSHSFHQEGGFQFFEELQQSLNPFSIETVLAWEVSPAQAFSQELDRSFDFHHF